ncbi:MAG: hypothetical protein ACI91B_005053, partial [Planctomycetota bacterium]
RRSWFIDGRCDAGHQRTVGVTLVEPGRGDDEFAHDSGSCMDAGLVSYIVRTLRFCSLAHG